MRFFNIFKQKSKKKEIKLKDILSWSEQEKQNISQKITRFNNLISTNVKTLIEQLKKDLILINQVNLDNKKEEEKIKQIVLQNLENYKHHVQDLTNSLESLKYTENLSILKQIETIFFEFEKNSENNFEKATYLIGKELETTKKDIDSFFKNLKSTINQNKDLIKTTELIKLADSSMEEIKKQKNLKNQIKKRIENNNQEIKKISDKISEINKKIELTKKTKEYLKFQEKKFKLENDKQNFNELLSLIKLKVDFKKLKNVCHSNKKEMQLIKSFEEDFNYEMTKDENPEIFKLIKENKLSTQEILSLEKNFYELRNQIKNTHLEQNPIKELNNKIKNHQLKIQEIKKEITADNNKISKIQENINNVYQILKEKLKEINIILID